MSAAVTALRTVVSIKVSFGREDAIMRRRPVARWAVWPAVTWV
ncbi:hypothetical protein [Streptomyces sp. NPDC058291]|jgi:hypothetical protein